MDNAALTLEIIGPRKSQVLAVASNLAGSSIIDICASTTASQGSSTIEAAVRLMHCEELLRFFDLRKFGPRVEADEDRNEQFAGGLMPIRRLIELCK